MDGSGSAERKPPASGPGDCESSCTVQRMSPTPPFPAQHPFPAGSHGCESSISRVHLVLGYVQTSVSVAKGSSRAEHRRGGPGAQCFPGRDKLSSVQPHLHLCFPRCLDSPNFQLILVLEVPALGYHPHRCFAFPGCSVSYCVSTCL